MPFLRGILTGSLQEAGLEFEAAYGIASAVRDELAGEDEVCCGIIRQRVERHLEGMGHDVLARYRSVGRAAPNVLIRLGESQVRRYSRGAHSAGLRACGIEGEAASAVVSAVHNALVGEGLDEISVEELRRRTYERLREDLGKGAARRYLVWQEFRHGDAPLILLVGGTTGTGKSTTATRVADILDVVRMQSTDMLREVMRTMIPQRLVPALHTSSFTAWQTLHMATESRPELVVDGYLRQAELLSVAGAAVIQRAVTERVSVIIEGVHVHPSFLAEAEQTADAVVVRVMMAVMRPSELKRRIRGRGRQAIARRAKRYLEHFDEIWTLQTHLLQEADRADVTIVADEDLEAASMQVVEAVMRILLARSKATPESVFGR
jgi:2-phosphoglycerate kinase